MNNINELYRKLIVKHYRKPFNKGLIKNNHLNDYLIMKKQNIFCSDEIVLQVKLDNETVVDIKYEIQGCAILTASASLMSIYLKNKKIQIVIQKINIFCNMLQNKNFSKKIWQEELQEELQIFLLVKNFPGRFMCASMPWTLLLQIIQKY